MGCGEKPQINENINLVEPEISEKWDGDKLASVNINGTEHTKMFISQKKCLGGSGGMEIFIHGIGTIDGGNSTFTDSNGNTFDISSQLSRKLKTYLNPSYGEVATERSENVELQAKVDRIILKANSLGDAFFNYVDFKEDFYFIHDNWDLVNGESLTIFKNTIRAYFVYGRSLGYDIVLDDYFQINLQSYGPNKVFEIKSKYYTTSISSLKNSTVVISPGTKTLESTSKSFN